MKSLTAANAVITLSITGLYPSPVQLQGFSADNIYDNPAVDATETAMGVDGILSGGMVFNPIDQTFSLQADSESNTIFETWVQAQYTQKDVFIANCNTRLPALQRVYVATRGFLVNLPRMPTANRILQPRRYTIRWQRVTSTPQG